MVQGKRMQGYKRKAGYRKMKAKMAQKVRVNKLRQPIHYFKRKVYSQQVIAASTDSFGIKTDGRVGFGFAIANIPQISEFLALYDQYCIKGVKVQIRPKHTSDELITQGGAAFPSGNTGLLATVIDYDDAGNPTDLATMLQYQNFKETRTNQVHTRYFKPKVNMAVFRSGTTATINSPKSNVWIDCSAPTDIAHYGLKVFVEAPAMPSTRIECDILTTYYLAFKNVR